MPTLFPLVSEGWVVLGLDTRFLGGKWQKKNNPIAKAMESVASFGIYSSVTPTSKSA
jgi:hypothetical protein